MIIRLITQDKNSEQLFAEVDKFFDGYSAYYHAGVWKGNDEAGVTIEHAVVYPKGCVNEKSYEQEQVLLATRLAERIKELNEQEAVLIEIIDSTNIMI